MKKQETEIKEKSDPSTPAEEMRILIDKSEKAGDEKFADAKTIDERQDNDNSERKNP